MSHGQPSEPTPPPAPAPAPDAATPRSAAEIAKAKGLLEVRELTFTEKLFIIALIIILGLGIGGVGSVGMLFNS